MVVLSAVLRYFYFALNIFWAVIGILIVVAVAERWNQLELPYSIVLLVISVLIFASIIAGFWGGISKSPRILWTSASLLAVCLIIIVVGGHVLKNVRKDAKKDEVRREQDAWFDIKGGVHAMDVIQTQYSCCGHSSPADYKERGWQLPASCCKDSDCSQRTNVYDVGCRDKIKAVYSLTVVQAVMIFVIIATNGGLIALSAALAIHYVNKRRRQNY